MKYRALSFQAHPVDAKEDARIQKLTASGQFVIEDRQMAFYEPGDIVTFIPERNVKSFLTQGLIEEAK